MIMTSAFVMFSLIYSQPSLTNTTITPSASGIQKAYKSWADAPNNDTWSKVVTNSKVSQRVYKPRVIFSGFIVGDQRDSFEYGAENRQLEGESIEDYSKRMVAFSQEALRKFKLGVPIYDNNSTVSFMGFQSTIGALKSRQILLYIDSTPKDDTTKVGSVLFHHGESSRILQELDNLLNLARRWRADGNSHDEREKSFTYGSEYSDHFTVKISQRSGSDNLMWQVVGMNGTEFTSQYTKSYKDAPLRKLLTDSKGKVIQTKDGSLKKIANDGFSEFAMFVNQLRTVVNKLDAIQ